MNSREFEKRLRHLRQVEHIVQPDLQWMKMNRERLVLTLQADQASKKQFSFVGQIRSFVQQFVPVRLLAYIRGPVAAAVSGIGIILGGSIASVSAAERALPGDLLYPVKLVTEQTRLVFVSGKTEKLKLKTEFVGRRVDEIKQIVKQDTPERPQRLKDAAAVLKQDLDTVKNQLNDVGQEQPVDRATIAKQVDQAGTDIVTSLKEVKSDAPQEVRADIADAEAAAVSTSLKAVQVILDSQGDKDAQKVVSREEIAQSISAKVDGVAEHLTDATKQLTDAGALSASTSHSLVDLHATNTIPLVNGVASTTTATQDLLDAHASLAEAKQLLSEDKLEQVGSKLAEASKAVASVEKKAEALTQAATSTMGVPPLSESSSTATTTEVKPPSGSSTTTVSTTTNGMTPPSGATTTATGTTRTR